MGNAGAGSVQQSLMQSLTAGSNITPEQLILAAQQLQAQQQNQGMQPPAAQPASMDLAALYRASAAEPMGYAGVGDLTSAAGPADHAAQPGSAPPQATGEKKGDALQSLDPFA